MRSARTRRRSCRGLPTVAAAVAGALLLGGCSARPQARAGEAPAGWTAYRDASRGFEVQFPSDWRRARGSLTPVLVSPREILSLGTGPLRAPGPEACSHMPMGALDAMGPRDVFVSVQERVSAGQRARRAHDEDFRGPVPSLRLDSSTQRDGLECVDARREDVWWLTFRVQGRGFYLLVAMGHETSPDRRSQAQRVLRSLRFARATAREAG